MADRCPDCGEEIPSGSHRCPRCSTLDPKPTKDSFVGKLVGGRYRITRKLGQGGMGVVYEAEHVGVGQKVAVKFLHPTFSSDPEVARRFRNEARSYAQINHAHAVQLHDFGQDDDGNLFISMELLEGMDLKRTLEKEGKLPVKDALDVVLQVCEVLGAAHERGIVHRDLKPENIMLTKGLRGYHVKVLDFGLAHLAGSGSNLTAPGVVCGTPRYMSPEQAEGGAIDHRTDIYALGLVLIEALTGVHPFESPSITETLKKQVEAPVPRLAQLAPELGNLSRVDAAIQRATAKKKEQRFDSMIELARALSDEAATAPAPPPALESPGATTPSAARKNEASKPAPLSPGATAPSAARRREAARPAAPAVAVDLEPLLARIEKLAPQFGRAQGDLVALVSRARSGDYKGVLQNARLVVEVLLRSLVTQELKQTPGKAMLDELITKFRQQANAHVIPTNVLAHMGTVQAWGNLSSHDHAGGLNDEGVRLGGEEVATGLSSMAAILTWYAQAYGPGEAAVPVAEPPAAPAQPRSRGPRLAVFVALGVLVVGAPVAWWVLAGRGGGGAADVAQLRQRLDASYAASHEPAPPGQCQERAAGRLAKLVAASSHLGDSVPDAMRAQEGGAALAALEGAGGDSAEGAYVQAKALLQAGQGAAQPLSAATACAGFAAAQNLAGNVALKEGRREAAEAFYRAAADAAPGFAKPRFSRAVLEFQQGRVDEAIGLLDAAIALQPDFAEAHYALAKVHESKGIASQRLGDESLAAQEAAAAKRSYCKALELGNALAKEHCAP
jgi:eukaryotic-like serine/threonine-protein kinase